MSGNDFKLDNLNEGSIINTPTDSYSKYDNDIWRNAIKNIALGFALTLVTFSIFKLQYILPTIGVGLLYIGLRDIHKENKALNIAWIFSIINIIVDIFNLICTNTPLGERFNNISIEVLFQTIFQISFLFIFRKGLKQVFERADIKPRKDPILGIIIWRVIIVICIVSGLGSLWWIFIILNLSYLYYFCSFYKLSNYFNTINYKPSKVHKKISNRKFLCIYYIGCVVAVFICCLLSNHIKLNSIEFVTPQNSETREILIDKGFPRDIINDISDEEIALLKNAIVIESSNEVLMFDYEEETIENDLGVRTTNKIPGKYNLEATTIYAELKNNEMYVIEYFKWKDGRAYWHDGFSISNTQKFELISGRLLFEKKGINYSAEIPRLKNKNVIENDWFGDEIAYDKISGAVNYPFGSDKQRGYVFYRLDIDEGMFSGANIFNYIHYQSPFRIPYVETEQQNLMFSDKLRQHCTDFKTHFFR